MPASLYRPVDFIELTLAAELASGYTTDLTVNEAITSLQSAGWIVIIDPTNGDEVIKYTAKDNGTKKLQTLTRAVAGSDVTHAIGRTVYVTTSAQYVIQLIERQESITRLDGLLAITSTELTISSGAVTITKGHHSIDTESDAASDDLDTINGGSTGDLIFLRQENSARDVTLRHAAGNIKTKDGRNIVLSTSEQYVILIYDGSNWLVVAFYQGRLDGRQTRWILAGAFKPTVSNGCAALTSVETTAGRPDLDVLDFDSAAAEYAQTAIILPNAWDLSTITFIPIWTAMSGSGGVAWDLQGVAVSNDDTIDVAYGTVQTSVDTFITAKDMHAGPESSAITIAGTPAASDLVYLRLGRQVGHASDTLGVDARFVGVLLFFNTTKITDD